MFLNKIWTVAFIIICCINIIINTPENIINSIMNSYNGIIKTFSIIIFNVCFWNGIINVFKNLDIVNNIVSHGKFIVDILFRKEKKYLDNEDYKNISINILSNILGIGNAATASGLCEMKKLDKELKYKKENLFIMNKFVLINSASIQIIPLSIITLRALNNSQNVNVIILPIFFSSLIALIIGIKVMDILNYG